MFAQSQQKKMKGDFYYKSKYKQERKKKWQYITKVGFAAAPLCIHHNNLFYKNMNT